MRTAKRWTNATFTRRVDHEAGAHRGPSAVPGLRVCERCRAVYVNRRWTRLPARPKGRHAAVTPPVMTVCPGCQMVADGRFAGELRVSGGFLAGHEADIEHLLRNEADRAAVDNPLAQVVRIDHRAPGRLIVRTTTEHLAKRLGQALHKALRGAVHYEFSHENKFAHVTWSRDR